NPQNNQSYLSIIHPDFKIGQEKDLKVTSTIEIDGKSYFELESDYLRPLTVIVLNGQVNEKMIKCKVVGYRRGRPKLKNIQSSNKWNIGEIIPFKILEFSQFLDKGGNFNNSVILEVPDSTEKID